MITQHCNNVFVAIYILLLSALEYNLWDKQIHEDIGTYILDELASSFK